MTESIHIGATTATRSPTLKRPLTHLPQKLDEAACLQVLAQLDPHTDVASVEAARSTIDVQKLDDALEYHPQLGLDQRFRLKQALSACGILSLGRKV